MKALSVLLEALLAGMVAKRYILSHVLINRLKTMVSGKERNTTRSRNRPLEMILVLIWVSQTGMMIKLLL